MLQAINTKLLIAILAVVTALAGTMTLRARRDEQRLAVLEAALDQERRALAQERANEKARREAEAAELARRDAEHHRNLQALTSGFGAVVIHPRTTPPR